MVGALTEAAARGVSVRLAYDAGKPAAATQEAFTALAADPAPVGTAQWVTGHFAGTAVQTRAITAPSGQLMHSKYIVRDVGHRHAAAWTGSANWTDDAWNRQENNLITVVSSPLAAGYRDDFDQLWAAGRITGTGAHDGGQMGPIARQWAESPHDTDVVAHWKLLADHLAGKPSRPYTPTSVHDFMHDKVLVADGQLATGSYNFSANVQRNAENQLQFVNHKLADQFADYASAIAGTYR